MATQTATADTAQQDLTVEQKLSAFAAEQRKPAAELDTLLNICRC